MTFAKNLIRNRIAELTGFKNSQLKYKNGTIWQFKQ